MCLEFGTQRRAAAPGPALNGLSCGRRRVAPGQESLPAGAGSRLPHHSLHVLGRWMYNMSRSCADQGISAKKQHVGRQARRSGAVEARESHSELRPLALCRRDGCSSKSKARDPTSQNVFVLYCFYKPCFSRTHCINFISYFRPEALAHALACSGVPQHIARASGRREDMKLIQLNHDL